MCGEVWLVWLVSHVHAAWLWRIPCSSSIEHRSIRTIINISLIGPRPSPSPAWTSHYIRLWLHGALPVLWLLLPSMTVSNLLLTKPIEDYFRPTPQTASRQAYAQRTTRQAELPLE